MKKEYLVYAIIFILLCAIFHFWTKYSIESNTPFITDKLNQMKEDNKLMDSIGGFKYFEFSYNKNDFKFRDTVKYSITIKSDDKTLIYSGTQSKLSPDRWELTNDQLRIQTK